MTVKSQSSPQKPQSSFNSPKLLLEQFPKSGGSPSPATLHNPSGTSGILKMKLHEIRAEEVGVQREEGEDIIDLER